MYLEIEMLYFQLRYRGLVAFADENCVAEAVCLLFIFQMFAWCFNPVDCHNKQLSWFIPYYRCLSSEFSPSTLMKLVLLNCSLATCSVLRVGLTAPISLLHIQSRLFVFSFSHSLMLRFVYNDVRGQTALRNLLAKEALSTLSTRLQRDINWSSKVVL